MLKRWIHASVLALLLLLTALPVLAAQGGIGGVHFGPYNLAAEDSVTGDLVVFGPVTLGRDSSLTGDLAAFGALEMREGATVHGDVAIFGAATIAGTVEGQVFSAGELQLRAAARVEGNVSSAGQITQEEGAIVEGEIQRVDSIRGFNWDFPFDPVNVDGGDGPWLPGVEVQPSQPFWLQMLWKSVRGFLTILALGLFALFFASLWPRHVERVAETIVNVPLPSFGVGLLVFIGAGLVLVILTITICLSPFALIGGIIVGLGAVLGWVALGSVLGDQVLRGLFKAEKVTPVAAAVLGTVLLTTLAVLVHVISDCLYAVLIWPVIAFAAGAVALTRFGTMPYAATGNVRPPVAPPVAPSRRPIAPVPPAAPAAPVPAEPAAVPEEPDLEELPSPLGEDAV
ncbi:MAG: Polymer-forming cytoskeletal [Chloroflexi bacterium ADurb.Bin360]|nr:MAG: Polymer-forming cytoskeletal [Chloroflexi bacterium ADurb.Bin360]